MSRRRDAGLALALAMVVAVVLCGCRSDAAQRPRDALRALLDDLASADVAGACQTLTAGAVAELARDFGGGTCTQTLATATGYVRVRDGETAAVRHATILPTVDIPLSPAPYQAGSSTTTLRLAFDDPVLHERQECDIRLRLRAGVWRVDSGIDGLFTLLS